jgi:hypothetical protein
MGTLNKIQKLIMLKSGFLPREIHEFDTAFVRTGKNWQEKGPLQHVNYSAENFQSMIKNRREYLVLLAKLGLNRSEIAERIAMYYQHHRSKRSVFDLLQIENSPSAKQKPISDLTLLRKRVKRARVSRSLGGAYGKPLPKIKLPRNIPKPPKYPPVS